MKHTDAKSIGEIMSQYLNASRLDDVANAHRLEAFWGEIVGDYINKQTTNRFVKDRKLYVAISSAPLRNELMLNRSALVKRLNDITGANVIDDIIFR